MKFPSLAAPEVVILTTPGAANDDNFVKITTFLFQSLKWAPGLPAVISPSGLYFTAVVTIVACHLHVCTVDWSGADRHQLGTCPTPQLADLTKATATNQQPASENILNDLSGPFDYIHDSYVVEKYDEIGQEECDLLIAVVPWTRQISIADALCSN